MQRKRFFAILSAAALVVLIILTFTSSAWAAQYEVLFKFRLVREGRRPSAALVLGSDGHLYGTTQNGGAYHYGTAFSLAPNPDGSWTESVIHDFTGGEDGWKPVCSLVFDAAGNLYGTAWRGAGWGVVFKLTSNPDGTWTESVLYNFAGGTDGSSPVGDVIFDAAGNLYGTTSGGGTYGYGTVFELTPVPDGSWTEKVLHSFAGPDGSYPEYGLVFDPAGNLYGTTPEGGVGEPYPYGTVFKLTPNPDGSWTESVLHSFSGPDGAGPECGLIFDAAGNLYGTTSGGGNYQGVVFRLKPMPDGSWKERVIHAFGSQGREPLGRLVFDPAGNLYGTTGWGGPDDDGMVFKLTPNPDQSWKATTLHIFKGKEGAHSRAGLIFDAAGNLYGTTWEGGKGPKEGNGVIFRITP